jgi:CubicO group peptidase (beta-lactamase class C family)
VLLYFQGREAVAIKTEEGDLNQPLIKELGEFIKAKLTEFNVKGVAVGLIHDGKEYLMGYGVSNIKHPFPMDGDTLLQIGSISKTFTATLAMRLVDMGKLDLDAPVRTYIPDFKLQAAETAAKLTVRDLFTHKAGWVGDWFLDTGTGADAIARYVTEMANFEQLTPLGTMWSYNNASFNLAGRIIEIVSGLPYEQALEELIFKPLGIDNAFFFAQDVITRKFAVGHQGENVARPWALPRASHAAGAICTSVREMMKYARFQLGDGTAPDGTTVLKPEIMQEMFTAQTKASNNMADATAIAWMLREVGGVTTVGHGGATNGYMAAFQMIPEKNFAMGLLTNSSTGGQLNRDVQKWILENFVGVNEPELTPLEMPSEKLAEYSGTYAAALTKYEITVKDNNLVVQAIPQGGFPVKGTPAAPPPPPVRLAFYAEDKVFGLDEPSKNIRSEFLRHPDGSIGWYRAGGRIARPQK